MHILYLEDSSDLRTEIIEFLKDNNHTVQDCYAIDEAKEYLEDEPQVDCIITDLNMDDQWLGEHRMDAHGGELSGWVWVRWFVWENPLYNEVPCIFYSGYIGLFEGFLEESEDGSKEVFDAHRTFVIRKGKGFRSGDLQRCLEEIERERRAVQSI